MPTTPSGLQYEDTEVGTGAEAKAGQHVHVHYTGWLYNDGVQGAKFDSSRDRNDPFAFSLGAGQVIKGWDQGMVGLKENGKRQLTIPGDLAYGKAGAGDDIPPDATLKFDVKLIKLDRIESKILVEGKGDGAVGGDSCEVNYILTDADGKKIDSSYDRNQTLPVTIGRSQLITGFTAGLMGMKQGEKRKITIPYQFAYGEKGRPPVIAPKATLFFEIEMVKLMHGAGK